MTKETIIPANPGFSAGSIFVDGEGAEVALVAPVVGWEIDALNVTPKPVTPDYEINDRFRRERADRDGAASYVFVAYPDGRVLVTGYTLASIEMAVTLCGNLFANRAPFFGINPAAE